MNEILPPLTSFMGSAPQAGAQPAPATGGSPSLPPLSSFMTDPSAQPVTPAITEQKPGFIQSIVQSLASPFLRLGATGADIGAQGLEIGADAIGEGNSDYANELQNSINNVQKNGIDYGYFGKVTPLGQTGSLAGNLEQDVGTGLEAGSTVATGATGVPETVTGTAALFGGTSALNSAGAALSEGDDAKDTAYKSFIGGLTGAATGGVFKGAGMALDSLTSKLPTALYNNVLKISKNMISSGKSPAEFLANNGTWGTLGSILNESKAGIDEMNAAVAPKLDGVTDKIESQSIIDGAVVRLQKEYGSMYSTAQLEDTIRGLPINQLTTNESLDAKTANQLRSQIDSSLGSRYWLTQGTTPVSKDALAAVSNELRGTIQKVSDTSTEFSTLSKWIRTAQGAQKAIDTADQKFGLGFKDLLYTAGGFAAGGPVGGIGSLAAEKVMQSPVFKTGLAQVLTKVGGLATDQAGSISKTAVMNLLNGLIGTGQQKSQ